MNFDGVVQNFCLTGICKGDLRPLEFRGDLLEVLRQFPEMARRRAGHLLDLVQQGIDPDDWKPLTTVEPGVREIRVWDEHGTFRVIYVAKFAQTDFVLHCFQKKTQKTANGDIELATHRYKELVQELAQ
jgi:phage-related protein